MKKSRKYTSKQNFLVLLKRTKHYVGDRAHTLKMYKKYLQLVRTTGKCTRTDLFESGVARSKKYFVNRGHTAEAAEMLVSKIQSRGSNFYNGDTQKIIQRVNKRANTFAKKSSDEISHINALKGKGYDPVHLAKKHNISVDEAVLQIQDRKKRKVESFKKFMRNRDPLDTASRPFISFSKASNNFFIKLIEQCADFKLSFYFGDKEYFLYCEDTDTIKYYDLYIPEINLFIEYNGTHFHPRQCDNSFVTVAQSIERDRFKLNLANKYGIDVEYVWENTDENGKIKELVSLIEARCKQGRTRINFKR